MSQRKALLSLNLGVTFSGQTLHHCLRFSFAAIVFFVPRLRGFVFALGCPSRTVPRHNNKTVNG